MSRSPSPADPWARLLREVLDDDGRTRRADVLLSHLTTWVLALGAVSTGGALLVLHAPWWASTGAAGVSAAGLAWLRLRRRLGLTAGGPLPPEAPPPTSPPGPASVE